MNTQVPIPSPEFLRLAPRSPETPDWESKIDLVRRTVAAGASADELELFFHQARRAGLDPLARQIYFVKRKGRGVVQVGIDGLRLIADRTGNYAGSEDADFGGTTDRGYPSHAKVTVYKMVQGQRCPFSATARWDEYYPGDDQGFQWRKMPHAMLGKCAEALALRKAFPADMGGLYIHEEMEQADAPTPARSGQLEEHGLLAAAERVFGEPRVSSDSMPNREAFGYAPTRWPSARLFADPVTESQRKMMSAKAEERSIPPEFVHIIRRAVLDAYRIEDEASKAGASLFIDWLINASEDAIDQAVEFSAAKETADFE